MQTLTTYFPILGPTLAAFIAIFGWGVTHYLSISKDKKSKQREMRIQFLIEAYRRLEAAASRPESGKAEQDSFESALADIQLLGTKVQIEELKRFLDLWNSQNGTASINPILELLRAHLRKELDLELEIPKIQIFRFKKRLLEKEKTNK